MNLDLVATTAYLTCGALMLFLGFVVLRENPRQRVNLATAAMLVFGGLGPMLGAWGSLSLRDAGASPLFHDVFSRFAFLWEFFFPAAVLFALVFPARHPILRRWPRLDVVLFVPHVFHVALVLFSEEIRSGMARVEEWGYLTQVTGLVDIGVGLLLRAHVRFFSFVNLAMVLTATVLLMRSARKTINPKLRSQIRTIRWGLVFGLMLYTGGELIPTVFGLRLDRTVSLPLITVSLLVGATSIVLAIVRLGFLDVRFIVRRGLVYGLASGVIVALYLFVGKQIDRLSAQFVGANLPVFETTFLVLSLFLLQPVLAAIERMVDRGYSRDRSDLRNALTRLSADVSLRLDPAEVAASTAAAIRHEMFLESAAVLWRDRRTGVFTCLQARDTLETRANWAAGEVVFASIDRSRESIPVAEIREGPREREDRELLEEACEEMGASLAFPLVAGAPDGDLEGELVGVLFLGPKVTQTRITFEEISLVAFIARQVGTSLMNGALHQERMATRLLQEEVATARRIQQQLLPEEPPMLTGWEVAASNRPSRHVGGDYHDFLPLPDGEIGIAIGDVSGKGVPAALLMSNLQAALRVRAISGESLDRLVNDVNRTICRNTGSESFISFFIGALDPVRGKLTYTNAGHNAPLLVRGDGTVEELETGGLLLGVFPEATYERGTVELRPGDLLVLYTDGVTEATNERGDMYGEERLMGSLVEWRSHGAGDVHRRLLDEVHHFQNGTPPDDDLTVVLLKRAADGAVPDAASTRAAAEAMT